MDRNLRIRMILEAADRASRSLRDIASSSSRTGRALNETRERLRQLQRTQADIASFRSLKTGLQGTGEQMGLARERVASLARQMREAANPSRALTREFEQAKRAAAALKLQHEQESAELQRMRDRLRAAGVGTNDLVHHERELRAAMERTNREIQEQSRRLQQVDARARRFAEARSRFDQVQGRATGLAAGGFAAVSTGQTIARPVLGTIDAAAKYQSTMTDIAQKANLSRAAGDKLGQTLLAAAQAANRLPEEMQAGVDALAGFGLDPRDAMKMITPIGRAATAYKAEMADLASASFAVSDNLKVPIEQTGRVIDVMAAAGKAGAFEMKDMAQYFPALTAGYQALGQKGVGAVADLAAALQIARKGAGDASSAATNVSNILQKLSSPQTIKAFDKFGINLPRALKKAYAEGKTPLEAIAELTNKALKGDMSRIGFLFEDSQVQQGLRPIIANMEEYRRIRTEAMNSPGTTDTDFAQRMQDAAESTQRLAVAGRALATDFGTQLLPTWSKITGAAADWAKWLGSLAKRHPTLTRAIGLTALGLSALFVIIGGGSLAIAGLLAPFAALTFVAGAFNIAMLPLIGIVAAVVLGIGALIAISYLIYAKWGPISAWFAGLWEGIKRAFFASLQFMASAIMNFSPVGLMIRAFSALVAWLPGIWATVKALFVNGVSALGTAFIGFNPTSLLLAGFLALLGWLRGTMAGQLASVGADLIRGLIGGITGMLGTLKNAVVGAASSAASWFKEKLGIHSPSRVFMGFGGYMMQGLDQGIIRNQQAPVQRITELSQRIKAALAVGAVATAAPAMAAAAPPPAAAAHAPPGSGLSIAKVEIHIHAKDGQSATDIAEAVRKELERLERDRRANERSSMRDFGDGADA
ncbi:phage tail tape measure protein [Sphingomonas sp. CBMAI 2297]|uniref:phage tail tape measure protein n=1 Tax=Sphingomonas sp. CBMAI 2297 TaxID=2991720 RepID=UPI0024570264|nr:phage tail tape measure protein [Sphingomonas sp. CBMAI 2297]MDH4743145.1 phage tail tape measure protein [Sphingomonas sp. CBMAI 2297]